METVMIRAMLTLALASTMFGQNLPDAQQQAAIVENVRQKGTQFIHDLPNFVCAQETLRERDLSGTGQEWKTIDTIVEQVSFFDHREKYEVVSVNGKPAGKLSHDKLKNFRSSGEFGGFLGAIFKPKAQAELRWDRREAIGARPVDVIAYRVAQNRSETKVTRGSRKIIVAHHGWLYADTESGSVLRLVIVDEMPADFPIRALTLEVEHGLVDIAGQPYLLPLKSQLLVRYDKVLERSTIAFTRYRKFGAEAQIQFGDAAEAVKKQP
jgi:hypothetical protein